MTTAVRLTPAAQADLASIYDYTAGRWGKPQAERYVLSIRDACDRLASGDLRGRNAADARPDYLKHTVGSHVVFFKMTEDLVVIRILHARMDVSSRL